MGKIVDVYGNPLEPQTLARQQTDDNALLRRQWPEHPSLGLNVNRLYQLFQEAEQGNLSAQADFFCDMEERDGHLFAEMNKRRRALLTLPWQIVPPRNATEEEKKIAGMATEWFQDLPDFEALLFDLTDGIGHGFSPVEIEWARTDNLWFPRRFIKRPQRWFQTPLLDGEDIRLIDGSTDGAPLWSFGWVMHRHKAKCGGYPQSGLFRVLAWTYLFKNLSARDLAEFLEIYGLPMRVGKYPAGTDDSEKMVLMRAVMSLGREAAGIMPQGMDIDFQNAAAGQVDPFKFMIEWCERTQSKVILGATLTSQTEGGHGSRALGQVHDEGRHELLASDARQMAGTLTRELLWPLLALNGAGGDSARRMCRFVFDANEPEDLKKVGDALGAVVNAGLNVPRRWAHDYTGIPEPVNGEPVLTIPDKKDVPAALSALYDSRHLIPFTPAAALSLHADNSDQRTLDNAPQALTALTEEAMKNLLQPLVAALGQGQSPEVLHGMIDAAYPDLNDEEIRQLIENVVFVSDLWGRIRAG